MDYDVIDKECGIIHIDSLEDIYKIAQLGLNSNKQIKSFDLDLENELPTLTYSTDTGNLLKFALMINFNKSTLTEPLNERLEVLIDQGAEWIEDNESIKVSLTPEQEQIWEEAGGNFQNFLSLLETPNDGSSFIDESDTLTLTSDQVRQLPNNFLNALQSKGVGIDQDGSGNVNIIFTPEQVADGWVNALEEHLMNPKSESEGNEVYPEGIILEFHGEIKFRNVKFYMGGHPKLDNILTKSNPYKINSDSSNDQFVTLSISGKSIKLPIKLIDKYFYTLTDGTQLTVSRISGNYAELNTEDGVLISLPKEYISTKSPIFQMTYESWGPEESEDEGDSILSANSIDDLIKYAATPQKNQKIIDQTMKTTPAPKFFDDVERKEKEIEQDAISREWYDDSISDAEKQQNFLNDIDPNMLESPDLIQPETRKDYEDLDQQSNLDYHDNVDDYNKLVKDTETEDYKVNPEYLMELEKEKSRERSESNKPFEKKTVPGINPEDIVKKDYGQGVNNEQDLFKQEESERQELRDRKTRQDLFDERQDVLNSKLSPQEEQYNQKLEPAGLQVYAQRDDRAVRELQNEANHARKWGRELLDNVSSMAYELWSLMGSNQDDFRNMPSITSQNKGGELSHRQTPEFGVEGNLSPESAKELQKWMNEGIYADEKDIKKRDDSFDPTYNPGAENQGSLNVANRMRESGKRLKSFAPDVDKVLKSPESLNAENREPATAWLQELDSQYKMLMEAMKEVKHMDRPKLFNDYQEIGGGSPNAINAYSTRNEEAWKKYEDLIALMKSPSASESYIDPATAQNI